MKEGTIRVETIIHSAPEKVWQAWTDPAIISLWFGSDPEGKVLGAETDVRVGGRFKVCFADGDHTEHVCSGKYMEVIYPSRLSFTWQWKSEPGVETSVVVTMTPLNKATKMVLEHQNLFIPSAHNYAVGWKTTLEKLQNLIGRPDSFTGVYVSSNN